MSEGSVNIEEFNTTVKKDPAKVSGKFSFNSGNFVSSEFSGDVGANAGHIRIQRLEGDRQDDLGAYDPITNDIIIPKDVVSEYSDRSLMLILAHEESHRVFANLPEEAQEEITTSVLGALGDALPVVLSCLRESYGDRYYQWSADFSLRRTEIAKISRRGIKQSKPADLKDKTGVTHRVDSVRFVDELLAHLQEIVTSERLPRNPLETKQALMMRTDLVDALKKMMNGLNPQLRELLTSSGFFSIDSEHLLRQLREASDFEKIAISGGPKKEINTFQIHGV